MQSTGHIAEVIEGLLALRWPTVTWQVQHAWPNAAAMPYFAKSIWLLVYLLVRSIIIQIMLNEMTKETDVSLR